MLEKVQEGTVKQQKVEKSESRSEREKNREKKRLNVLDGFREGEKHWDQRDGKYK
jgi:hypothetical protein